MLYPPIPLYGNKLLLILFCYLLRNTAWKSSSSDPATELTLVYAPGVETHLPHSLFSAPLPAQAPLTLQGGGQGQELCRTSQLSIPPGQGCQFSKCPVGATRVPSTLAERSVPAPSLCSRRADLLIVQLPALLWHAPWRDVCPTTLGSDVPYRLDNIRPWGFFLNGSKIIPSFFKSWTPAETVGSKNSRVGRGDSTQSQV